MWGQTPDVTWLKLISNLWDPEMLSLHSPVTLCWTSAFCHLTALLSIYKWFCCLPCGVSIIWISVCTARLLRTCVCMCGPALMDWQTNWCEIYWTSVHCCWWFCLGCCNGESKRVSQKMTTAASITLSTSILRHFSTGRQMFGWVCVCVFKAAFSC